MFRKRGAKGLSGKDSSTKRSTVVKPASEALFEQSISSFFNYNFKKENPMPNQEIKIQIKDDKKILVSKSMRSSPKQIKRNTTMLLEQSQEEEVTFCRIPFKKEARVVKQEFF